jgi:hypothetical protein
MNLKPCKTAYELQEMIVEHGKTTHGPWPVLDDAYGRTAIISRPRSPRDRGYRACVLERTALLNAKYDLDTVRPGGPD